MNRNSSFFWASDDLRSNNLLVGADDGDGDVTQQDDHDGDYPALGLDLEPESGSTITSPLPPPPPPPPRDGEAQSLISSATSPRPIAAASGRRRDDGVHTTIGAGYGTTSTATTTSSSNSNSSRRTLFALREHSPVDRTPDTFRQRRKKLVVASTSAAVETRPLRFQVVIWHVGEVDVCKGQVPMRLRITMFWNDIVPSGASRTDSGEGPTLSSPHPPSRSGTAESEWIMKGRQRACRYEVGDDEIKETIDVPPVSILNAVDFDSVDAEISMVEHGTRLMRWTCMYRVILFQADHMTVEQFPHDKHDLKLKIGVLAHRGPGARWDRNVYRLGLATETDSQGSTKVSYGLVVKHVTIPDFYYNAGDLSFTFLPLEHGATAWKSMDEYLEVQLPVYRVSGHYDRSIMPMLALLNVVAITCIPRNFSSATASTETLLSIAFVQVGIRLTIDSRLPSVGYPIKMQKILNRGFWLLCALALESNVVFLLVIKFGWEIAVTDQIDLVVAALALLYTGYILILYYGGRAMPPPNSMTSDKQ